MIQPSKNNLFTAADIERYHAGTLTDAERHALEKAALDDPFLADALEGYDFTPTPAADLQALRQRLAQRVEEKKRGGIFPLYRSWMRVAALLVLMAGGVWVFWRMNGRSTQVALETPAVIEKKPVITDSTALSSDKTDAAASGVRDEVERPAVVAPGRRATATAPAPKAEANEPVVVADAEGIMRRNRADAPAAKTDTTANILGYGSVNNVFSNSQVQAGPARNPKELTNNSTADNSVVLKDKYYNRPNSDTLKNFNVVLKPLNQPPSDVVVLSKNLAKKTEGLYSRSRMQGVVLDSLEPAEGWVKFGDYVAANLQTPEEKDKPERGDVQLAFDVNNDGAPVNITVVKSLCAKCDEEAVRLLREGPKWKKKKRAKGKVTIHF